MKKKSLRWRNERTVRCSEEEEETKARTEEKKQEDSVLHQVETSSDRSGADTQNNIHQKEQWSGPWH